MHTARPLPPSALSQPLTHSIRPASLVLRPRHSLIALALCPLLALMPAAPLLAAPKAKSAATSSSSTRRSWSKPIASLPFEGQVFQNVSVAVTDTTFWVRRGTEEIQRPIETIAYKTLDAAASAAPELLTQPAFKKARAAYLPFVALEKRMITGVKLKSASGDDYTLITDSGEITCKADQLSEKTRAALRAPEAHHEKLLTAASERLRADQERIAREREAKALADAQRAAEEQRLRAEAYQREVAAERARIDASLAARNTSRAPQKSDSDEGIGTLGKVIIGGAVLLGGALLLKGLASDSGSSSSSYTAPSSSGMSESERAFQFQQRRDRENDERRLEDQRRQEREAAAAQRQRWADEADAGARARAAEAEAAAQRRAAEADAAARARNF